MLFVVPNSGGLPEPEQALLTPLTERWSDEARVASAAVRRARAKYPTKDDKKHRTKTPTRPPDIDDETVKQVGDKVKARTRAEHDAQKTAAASYEKIHADRERVKAADVKAAAAAAKKKSGGGKKDASPAVERESKNDKGERVLHYSDGSTVTVHKDGKTATHTKADGSSTTGKYRDPAPSGSQERRPKGFTADTPESTQRAADAAARKTESERRKAATAANRAARAKAQAERKRPTRKSSSRRQSPHIVYSASLRRRT